MIRARSKSSTVGSKSSSSASTAKAGSSSDPSVFLFFFFADPPGAFDLPLLSGLPFPPPLAAWNARTDAPSVRPTAPFQRRSDSKSVAVHFISSKT